MLGFRRHRQPRQGDGRESHQPTYRYRVDSREALLQKYELVALRPDPERADDRQRLARVLEEVGKEGWRLVGISGTDFIFRRRA
jgi:hypothetical protein